MKTIDGSFAPAALRAMATAALAGPAPRRHTHRLAMARARRTIARRLAAGPARDAQYEREGCGRRYSFDVAEDERIHEIGVDDMSGRIVKDSCERLGSRA